MKYKKGSYYRVGNNREDQVGFCTGCELRFIKEEEQDWSNIDLDEDPMIFNVYLNSPETPLSSSILVFKVMKRGPNCLYHSSERKYCYPAERHYDENGKIIKDLCFHLEEIPKLKTLITYYKPRKRR